MEVRYYRKPFDHWVIDNFIEPNLAFKLSDQFLDYDSDLWYVYSNPLEKKKTLRDWYRFPSETYRYLHYLNSQEFLDKVRGYTGTDVLYADTGLHGAGWHIHKRGDKLNVHLDYSIHPQLKLQRKYNIIIYMTPNWNPNWGGNLEFWSHDHSTGKPKECATVIENRFNRAVIFDTTQHSWHGFPDPLQCPDNVYRKSIAMYYLTNPPTKVDPRERALYAPTKDQETDPQILKLIEQRSHY